MLFLCLFAYLLYLQFILKYPHILVNVVFGVKKYQIKINKYNYNLLNCGDIYADSRIYSCDYLIGSTKNA